MNRLKSNKTRDICTQSICELRPLELISLGGHIFMACTTSTARNLRLFNRRLKSKRCFETKIRTVRIQMCDLCANQRTNKHLSTFCALAQYIIITILRCFIAIVVKPLRRWHGYAESFATVFVGVSGGWTFPEVEVKSGRTGAWFDVRGRVDARSTAVVDVAEMIRFTQRTRRQRRTISVHVGWRKHTTHTDVTNSTGPCVKKLSAPFGWNRTHNFWYLVLQNSVQRTSGMVRSHVVYSAVNRQRLKTVHARRQEIVHIQGYSMRNKMSKSNQTAVMSGTEH